MSASFRITWQSRASHDILLHSSNACPPVMQFLIDKISGLAINWNQRTLDQTDFDELCNRFNITVQEVPLSTAGFYYRLLGRDFIALDSGLEGPRRLAVLFHEFAHFLFHTSETGPAAGFHHTVDALATNAKPMFSHCVPSCPSP